MAISGTEMMVKTLLKAIGFDPQEFIGGLQRFISDVYKKMEDFDRRFLVYEENQRQIIAMLEELTGRDKTHESNVVSITDGSRNDQTSGAIIPLDESEFGSIPKAG